MSGEKQKSTDAQSADFKRQAHVITVAMITGEITNYTQGLAGYDLSRSDAEKMQAWAAGVAEGIVLAAEQKFEWKHDGAEQSRTHWIGVHWQEED